MKVLFIHPEGSESYPIQIGALSAFLKQHGHAVSCFQLVVGHQVELQQFSRIHAAVQEQAPGLIAFSCYETTYSWINSIATYIKEHFKIPMVIGGYYPTLAPEDIITNRNFDYLCRGEGEYPLLELCESLEGKRDAPTIQNLWMLRGETVIRNPVRPLLENLDELPFQDRDLVDMQGQLDRGEIGNRSMLAIASRGCPYNCTYCSNVYFRKLYPNQKHYLRMRSVEHLIAELEMLKKKYSFDSIAFADDNLTLFPDWLDKFAKLYKEKINLPFYCASRVERCTEEVLGKLKEAGCYMLLFGVESGDEQYRKQHMKRFMTNEQIVKAFRLTRSFGLKTWAFNIIGMPYEKRSSVWKTLALNFRIRPSFAMTTIYYPFKGTDMGNICYKNGWVNVEKQKRVGTYAFDSVLNHPHMSNWEIRFYKYLCILAGFGSSVFCRALVSRASDALGLRSLFGAKKVAPLPTHKSP